MSDARERPIRFGDRVRVIYRNILVTGAGWVERVEFPCGPFRAVVFLWDSKGSLRMVPFGSTDTTIEVRS